MQHVPPCSICACCAGDGPQHAYAAYLAQQLQHWFGWDVVHEYFKGGVFRWQGLPEEQQHGSDRPPLDW